MTRRSKDETIYFGPHFTSTVGTPHWDEPTVGKKAAGLATLPAEWTPPFFAVVSRDSKFVCSANRLKEALDRLAELGATELIVRSSATNESLDERGRFRSQRCSLSSADVAKTMTIVADDSRQVVGELRMPANKRIGVIVQQYLESARFGHLSNERRVSREITSWHLEYQETENDAPLVTCFSIKRQEPAFASSDLICDTATELLKSLKSLAIKFSSDQKRVHIEWLWDGHRVWVVQCDEETLRPSPPPGSSWSGPKTVATLPSLSVLTPALNAKHVWPKTQAIRAFDQCGLRIAPVFVLEDERTLRKLANGSATKSLRDDLEILIAAPILIRTDYSDQIPSSGLLLPRTGAVSRVADAIEFLIQNARENIDKGIAPSDFCFALHRFIAARGAAYSLSKPQLSRVYIDSTWGSPDSLSYYPHDSFEIDARDRKILRKRIRCKTHYLDMNSDGTWTEIRSGKPWDWKSSLTAFEAFEIAEGARHVADLLGKPVEIMWLFRF
jgi:hypothetical protein